MENFNFATNCKLHVNVSTNQQSFEERMNRTDESNGKNEVVLRRSRSSSYDVPTCSSASPLGRRDIRFGVYVFHAGRADFSNTAVWHKDQ